MTAKFRNMTDSSINKMFAVIGGVGIAVDFLLLGLFSQNSISFIVCVVSVFVSVFVLTGLFYALHKVSKRSRFMFA